MYLGAEERNGSISVVRDVVHTSTLKRGKTSVPEVFVVDSE